MKISNGDRHFELPSDLRSKLVRFRQRVWGVKTAEAVFAVFVLLTLSYLAVFLCDRLGETPALFRLLILMVGLSGLVIVLPLKLYRWIWGNRNLTDLARLLAHDQPRVGDRLLGIIELAQNTHDEHASPALCEAAILQVADDTREIDFQRSVPHPQHKRWGWAAGLCFGLALVALLVRGAGTNALQRWSLPLADIPRYTFAQLSELPERLVVPIGEPFTLTATLSDSSVWSPRNGSVRYGGQKRIRAALTDNGYAFDVPSQTVARPLTIAIGDARHRIHVEPKPRPELTALVAHIALPNYLGYPQQQRDARSGAVSIVKGSHAQFEATVSRELADASVNGKSEGVELAGATIRSPPVSVDETDVQEFHWTDIDRLSSKSPFHLRVRSVNDRAPSVQCSDLPTEKVVLDEDTLSFQVVANDDFGVKQVGVEWSGVEDLRRNPNPDKGEYLLAGGGQDKASLNVQGTFAPKNLGIKPQPIHLRVYVEDYLPGRERVYSPMFRLYVLNRQQHMIWVTEQLEQWERQALEVRDQEQRLLETNKQLQQLSAEELDKETTRRQIARQAAAERANARRLSNLTSSGEQLITEAARNDEFNVASLEKWAQMLKVLKQLSSTNMPSVANLLGEAANAPASTDQAKPPTAPSITDVVSGARRDPDESGDDKQKPSTPSQGQGVLGLPETTLAGSPSPDSQNAQCPTGQKVDEAVEEQEQLLAEFNRVMGELSKLLQDLQGSTFVKRLKAAARNELSLASSLHGRLQNAFGEDATALPADNHAMLRRLNTLQLDTATDVRLIQEDLAAYFERTKRTNFKTVHDEMTDTQVVSNFKQMSPALTRNMSGETIAQAEYWSDQLDRWAEILVGPG